MQGEVQIGDVGVLVHGGFHPLFNITVDAEHERNARGVPDGFIPLQREQLLFDKRFEEFVQDYRLQSSSMKGLHAGAKLHAYVTRIFV